MSDPTDKDTPPTKKAKLSDANFKKKSRIELDLDMDVDPDSKDNNETMIDALLAIMHAHEMVLNVLEPDFEAWKNIDYMCNVSSYIWLLHRSACQEMNKVGNVKSKILSSEYYNVNEWALRNEVIKPGFKDIMKRYGFEYCNQDAAIRKKLGILSYLLALLIKFKNNLNEICIGYGSYPDYERASDWFLDDPDDWYEPEDWEKIINNFYSYHFESYQHVLLNGCHMEPSLQLALRQSLGPLIIALQLCRTKNTKLHPLVKSIFTKCFQTFPNVDSIANLLCGSENSYPEILKNLGDLCHLGAYNAHCKMSPPMAMILTVARNNAEYSEAVKKDLSDIVLTRNMLVPELTTIDFNGTGMYHFYRSVCMVTDGFSMKSLPKMTENMAKEMVYHSMFNSHFEDLSILEYMTENKFMFRHDMLESFATRNSSTQTLQFSPIPFIKVCQLAVSPLSDYNISPGVLEGNLRSFKTFPDKKSQILDELHALKGVIRKKLSNSGNVLHTGTSPWFVVDNTSSATCFGTAIKETFKIENRYFFSSRKE